jgi:hypothetical protein
VKLTLWLSETLVVVLNDLVKLRLCGGPAGPIDAEADSVVPPLERLLEAELGFPGEKLEVVVEPI